MSFSGSYDTKFQPVVDRFVKNFTELGDVGASFAATIEGEYVIDIYDGHRNAAKTEPWQADTIVNVYSTTKTMTFLTILLLVERGQLSVTDKVAKHWPEFAQNGKEAIEVRHLLSHSAGLSGVNERTKPEDLYDWEKITQLLAAQAPWWEPGTQSGYHAITQGYLLGEVVRRITGKTIGTYFKEEIAEPLGADFHIGVDPKHHDRIAELIPPPAAEPDPNAPAPDPESIALRTFMNPSSDVKQTTTAEWRQAEIPAANGHGNARSVVQVQSVLANLGSFSGVDLLSKETCLSVMTEQTNGMDLVLGVPMVFGLGYGLRSAASPMGVNPNTCFWGGYGGSSILVDMDAHVCLSYVMNKMEAGALGDPRGFGLAAALFSSLTA
ncbi:MAG: beta-lactamase family protein [Gammaproteobacteria bacterium]|nr:beta-lactamase family protein [Gammaproteobacteria bacterium]